MKSVVLATLAIVLTSGLAFGQADFEITGTAIPPALLQKSYGGMPKGVAAYDLNICNVSDSKQSLLSSRIFQALSQSYTSLEPIGREIMLAAILHNQSHSLSTVLTVVLGSTSGVLSILGSSRSKLPSGLMTSLGLASLSGQQILSSLKPIFSADQVEKFESEVLEPALVMDGGSCVERTIFVAAANNQAKSQPLSFHVR